MDESAQLQRVGLLFTFLSSALINFRFFPSFRKVGLLKAEKIKCFSNELFQLTLC